MVSKLAEIAGLAQKNLTLCLTFVLLKRYFCACLGIAFERLSTLFVRAPDVIRKTQRRRQRS